MSDIELGFLDLNHVYSIEEFEYISNLVKNHSLVIDNKPIHHFELANNGKLIFVPSTTPNKEAVVVKIASLLEDWNVTTRQKGIVTTSQQISTFRGQSRSPYLFWG